MIYALILGRVYTLSLAEIVAVLKRGNVPSKILEASEEAVIIETEQPLDFEKLQKELGGTIQIVKIIDVIKKREKDSINFALQNYFTPSKLKKDYFKDYSGKKQFGISVFLLDKKIQAFGEPRRLGMFIKKGLQNQGISLRAVFPEFNSLALSSVAITKNQILQKGASICAIASPIHVYVGKTLCVQDFEDYGRRDYQRPMRDEKQGMLPPKVAQIMVNLAELPKGKTILDPFCGAGTILQEAILLGYKALGSDISKTAIRGAEANLEWFRNRYKIAPGKYALELSSAEAVSEPFKGKKIDSIVSEGYLGPLYAELPKISEINANFEQISHMWAKALEEFKKILEKGSKIVFSMPAYKKNFREYILFPQIDFISNLGYTIEDLFPTAVRKIAPFIKETERHSIIYDRKDQIVAREIFVIKN